MNFDSTPASNLPNEERKQRGDGGAAAGDSAAAAAGSRHNNASKNAFPFTLLYKVHDQMDEIVDIDCNHVLDMYVTLSKDGTIALRCMRTSQLYQHFLLMNKLMSM